MLNAREDGQNSPEERKLSSKIFHGYEIQSIQLSRSRQKKKLIYQKIIPVGLGKIDTLRTKIQLLIGKSAFKFDQQKQLILRPQLQYVLRKMIAFQCITAPIKTDFCRKLAQDLSNIVTDSDQTFRQIQRRSFQLKQICEKYFNKKNIQNSQRIQKLKLWEEYVHEQKKVFIQKLKKQQEYRDQPAKVQQVLISNLMKTLDKVQLLRYSQRNTKQLIFQKRNQKYFNLQVVSERKEAKPYSFYKINLNCSNPEQPLLQSILDMVQLRDMKINYIQQSKILIKDTLLQVIKYGKDPFYHYLQPDYVIFDHISLRIRLSYVPIILDMMGLKNKVMTKQNMICFYPTPQSFDYFRSLKQFDSETILKLNDPYYGCIQMYDSERHRLAKQQRDSVQKDRIELDKLKQQITLQRFTLFSYYLLNGQQLGFQPNLRSFAQKQSKLKQKLAQAKSNIENGYQRQKYLGIQNSLFNNKSLSYKIDQFDQYFFTQSFDSVLQSNKYITFKKYIYWRNCLIQEQIRMLINDVLFKKISNLKKYIIIYFLGLVQYFQENRKLLQANQKLKVKTQRKKMRQFLQNDIRRQKKSSYRDFISKTYQKISKYRSSKAIDHNSKFISEQMGKSLIQYVDLGNKTYLKIQQLSQTMNKIEQDLIKEDYQKIETQMRQLIQEVLPQYKSLLSQLILYQMKLCHKEGPHGKLQLQQLENTNVKDYFQLMTLRLQIISLIYTNISQQNLITYDTIILPQLKIENNERRIQFPTIFKGQQAQLKSLKVISELINAQKLQPTKFRYLKVRGLRQSQYSSTKPLSFRLLETK